MTRAAALPLLDGRPLSVAEYREAAERAMSEREIQRTLLADLADPRKANFPNLSFHIPNGIWLPTKHKKLAAQIWRGFERDGALAGAPDLVVAFDGRVLLLELKRVVGRLTDDQARFADKCLNCGVDYRAVFGLADARATLTSFGVLRGE